MRVSPYRTSIRGIDTISSVAMADRIPRFTTMRIGICTWGSEGDLRPMVALAQSLVARGHTVLLEALTIGEVQVPPAQEGLTVTLHPAGIDLQQVSTRLGRQASPTAMLVTLFEEMLRPFVPLLTDIATRQAQQTEVMVGHFVCHPHHAAARGAGKPWVSVVYFPGLVPTAERSPLTVVPNLGRPLNRLLWWLAQRYFDRLLLADCQTSFRAAGQELAHVIPEAWLSRDLTLVAASPALWPVPADWPATCQAVGEWTLPGTPAPLPAVVEAFLHEGPAPVFFGLGSPQQCQPVEATRLLSEAALRWGGRGLIRSWSPEFPPGRRDGDVLWVGAVDHRALFPRCAAVVHHGGAGTSHAAARAGVPQAVVAFLDEQVAWGKALGRAGVAPKPLTYRTATAKRLARRVRQAITPARQAAAKALQQRMDGEDGLSTAIAAIERLSP